MHHNLWGSGSCLHALSFLFFTHLLLPTRTASLGLELMTYNTRNFNDGRNWSSRCAGIARVVKEENPDIIAFQVYRHHACTSGVF